MATAGEWVAAQEVARRAEDLARQKLMDMNDKRIADMAYRDSERLAKLETEMSFVRRDIARMSETLDRLDNVLTKAAGVKVAGMALVAGLGFALSQLWHWAEWKGH